MIATTVTAEYLPTLGLPALCLGHCSHALGFAATEQLIQELQFALLRARIDAKKISMEHRRMTPALEMQQLLQMVDMQLAKPEPFPTASPASEVTP